MAKPQRQRQAMNAVGELPSPRSDAAPLGAVVPVRESESEREAMNAVGALSSPRFNATLSAAVPVIVTLTCR